MRQAADEEFADSVRGHRTDLARLSVALIGNRGHAEDLLQDALLKCYLSWRRITPGGAYPYARRVLANLAVDRWRRRRYETVPGAEGDLRPDGAAASAYAGVDDRDHIVRELARLTPRERAMVVLRYYADLPEADVADTLGVSVGTVKSTCSRALAHLRQRTERTPA